MFGFTKYISNGKHGFWSFVTFVYLKKPRPFRNKIMGKLQSYGIASRPGRYAVHMLEVYKDKFYLNLTIFLSENIVTYIQ